MNPKLSDLKQELERAKWFTNLGTFSSREGAVALSDLSPWGSGASGDEMNRIADDMEWLPSSRDQRDPIHGDHLEKIANELDLERELKEVRMDMHRLTLVSLRRMKAHPLLKSGANDFTEAAKGAALYCARRSATEIVVGRPGFWSKLIFLHSEGYWPCGLLSDGSVVVL